MAYPISELFDLTASNFIERCDLFISKLAEHAEKKAFEESSVAPPGKYRIICFDSPPYKWILGGDFDDKDVAIDDAVRRKISLGLDSPTHYKVYDDQGKYVGGSV